MSRPNLRSPQLGLTSVFASLIAASLLLLGPACGDSKGSSTTDGGGKTDGPGGADAAHADVAHGDAANSDVTAGNDLHRPDLNFGSDMQADMPMVGPDMASGPDFSCVGHNAPATPMGPMVMRQVGILDPIQMMPIPDVTITLLDKQYNPIGVMGTTASAGQATIAVPVGTSGYDGIIHLTKQGFVDVFAPIDQAITVDGGNTLLMVTTAERDAVAAVVGVSVDDNANSVAIVLARDCVGNGILGAELSTDNPAVKLVYVGDNAMPDPNATSTASTGAVVLGEIPPGPITLTVKAAVTDGGPKMQIGTLTFTAKNGTLTEAIVDPE